VATILNAIDALPFRDQVTLVVTTDHGMIPVTTIVNIAKILRNHGIEATFKSSGTTSFVYLADRSQSDRAAAALSGYTQFDVVRKEAQPAGWHIGSGPRVGDLIVSAHPPYFIEDLDRWPSWLQWLGRWGPEFLWARFSLKATHGYPPGTPGVEGILYAWGAGIARGREIAEILNIDLHPTVCALLGLRPGNPVDGRVAEALLAAEYWFSQKE
jgi:arylsulfatase A-like enzyme